MSHNRLREDAMYSAFGNPAIRTPTACNTFTYVASRVSSPDLDRLWGLQHLGFDSRVGMQLKY